MIAVTHGLRRNARHRPEQLAYIDGQVRRTWTELESRVARLASGLQRLGAKERARVCVLAENSSAFYDAYLASPWAGAILSSLNTRWSLAEMAAAVRDCEPAVLIADAVFMDHAAELRKASPSIRHVICASDALSPSVGLEELVAGSRPVADEMMSPEECFALFYTGGTTGRSKGVMLAAASCQLAAMGALYKAKIDERSVLLLSAPIFHMAGGLMVFAQLLAGATGVLARRFEPGLVLEAVKKERVTHALWVPTMLRMLLDAPSFDVAQLASLRAVMYGASPMPEPLLRRAMHQLPDVDFFGLYGMTETSAAGVYLSADDHRQTEHPERLRAAGQPNLGVDVKIVDARGTELPAGQHGEICMRGPVCLGYWNDPESTRKAIVDGWMHTGDGGWMDEHGYVFVGDRLKDMVISGGENVYSAEVESVLAGHAAVAECAVIGLPDPKWGEIVVAVVRLKPGADADASALEGHCRERLGGYKVPRRFLFREEPLPLSGTGKILKTRLREQYSGAAAS